MFERIRKAVLGLAVTGGVMFASVVTVDVTGCEDVPHHTIHICGPCEPVTIQATVTW